MFADDQSRRPRRATLLQHSPQFQALLDNRHKICLHVQSIIAPFADLLLKHRLIDSSLNQKTGEANVLSNYQKAGELMTAVQNQVESDDKKFEAFLCALKEAGPGMEDLAQQLSKPLISL